ncbi:MAG: class II SORL domain-containing protein [Anaerolineales bacterium]|nr:class II SORL domain-containing protein [Anaerolineales bacterium]
MFIQKDDWKKEKHMPVIEVPAQVKVGEAFQVKVSIGKEIPHPNTTEHHIDWIDLYFHPEGEKFPHQVGHFAFTAHGEAVTGPNQGPVYTQPELIITLKVARPGVFHALALCNIHGLWESEQALALTAPDAAQAKME